VTLLGRLRRQVRCRHLRQAKSIPKWALTGKGRLPSRRVPSKLCATLDSSRRLRMDGNPPLKLRYLPAPVDPSRPSLLSASSALAKSDGLAKGRTSCAEPWTMSDGVVGGYFSRLGGSMYTHERVTLSGVAETIAQIKGAKFAGLYDNARSYPGNVFFVPDDTLVLDEASRLGIRLPTDLFGAVVPFPFAKTK